ncbi:DNA topoisomerase 2 [Thoreauomyces humboldtii]|nr:DNA topoisomerase 2 [Thoreauomyces humboldtii]
MASSCDEDWDSFEPAVKKVPATKAAAKPRAQAKVTKPKATTAKAKTALGEANMDASEEAQTSSKPKPAAKAGSKTVEEIYQKKSQLEHILIRPDTYIGSIESQTVPMWVYEDEKMVWRNVTYVPGLYKIFDEIIVNAADNKVRDSTMDTIKVNIDKENNTISVYNNGRGIPVEMHSKEQVYVPELIFGHLLTSSNYDDDEKKVTGGRNGYGAKLCNIFSTEFVVETADSVTGRKFVQTYSDNMSKRSTPKISPNPKGENFTRITFKPDLARFGMASIDADFEALVKKRAFDLAGCVRGVKVSLNDVRLKLKDFKDYADLYLSSNAPAASLAKPVVIYERPNERWEIAFTLSDGQFQQVSFVNSICTTKGGTHVTHVVDQLVAQLIEAVKKKDKKGVPLKPFQAKNHLWVFVNCNIENPAFDSQTKENMTLRQSSFGSKCVVSDDFMKKVLKSGVVDNILSFARFKQDQLLKKTDGAKRSRITGLTKLDDANNAGTKHGQKCTLILTEGDSAKTLAVSGLSVIGRDNFGVFPLRGKVLNVREASHQQITANAEINAIKQIMGLQHGKVYTSTESLRYGHLMIMSDQDHDGSHIKGLIINLIDHFWPSLLKVPGFLLEFITPIVRVHKGTGPKRAEVSFFTIPEYDAWRLENDDGKAWTAKYYKGLGSSGSDDAKKYFGNLDKHLKTFGIAEENERELIDLAFSKKKADDRKEWLRQFQPGTYMNHDQATIPLSDFVNKELILFSMADNARSIPSAIDGLKPGQRKIMFCCFKRKLKGELKVQQLGGYVSEHSAYHHGEASLYSTIVGLAQNFVGSNNLPMLEPRGQFGTRLQGGKDAASPRYIFTTLSPLARALFLPADDALLTYQTDDGQNIEPEWYMPVLPMLLVNGAEGIGTGWSTSIPNYNPRDIVENLFRLLDGEELIPMHPWYRGFQGEIEATAKDKYRVTGIITKLDDTTVEISELPIRCWTQNYKEDLESWLVGTDKQAAWIKDYKEYHTDAAVRFVITLSEEQMIAAEKEGLEKRFKLVGSLSTSNLVCFDAEGRIKKYETIDEIFTDFYPLRRSFYQKRKDYILSELNHDLVKLDNKVRFVTEIIKGTIVVQNKKKDLLLEELERRNYDPIYPKKDAVTPTEEGDEEAAEDQAVKAHGYDYLLTMPIWNLTMEKVEALIKQRDQKESEVIALTGQSVNQLWRLDLDAFLVQWDHFETTLAASDAQRPANDTTAIGGSRKAVVAKKTAQSAVAGMAAKAKPAPKKPSNSDSGSDFMDETSAVKPEVIAKPKRVAKAPAAKAAPKTTKAAKSAEPAAIDVENLAEDLSAITITKAEPKKRTLGGKKAAEPGQPRAPAKLAAAKTSVKPEPKPTSARARMMAAMLSDSDVDDDVDMDGLAASTDALDLKSTVKSKPAPPPTKARVATKVTKPAPVRSAEVAAPPAKRAPRRKIVVDSDSDETVASRSPSPPPPRRTAVAADLSDETEGEGEEDDGPVAARPKKTVPAASRRKPVAAATKTTTTTVAKPANVATTKAKPNPPAGRATRGKQPVKYFQAASDDDNGEAVSDFEGSQVASEDVESEEEDAFSDGEDY